MVCGVTHITRIIAYLHFQQRYKSKSVFMRHDSLTDDNNKSNLILSLHKETKWQSSFHHLPFNNHSLIVALACSAAYTWWWHMILICVFAEVTQVPSLSSEVHRFHDHLHNVQVHWGECLHSDIWKKIKKNPSHNFPNWCHFYRKEAVSHHL